MIAANEQTIGRSTLPPDVLRLQREEVRSRRRRTGLIWLGRLALLVLIIVVWQAVAPSFDPLAVSPPTAIARQLGKWATNGTLVSNLNVTVQEVVFGYLGGSAAAILTGFVLGSNRILAGIMDPLITALYGIPKIALGPLFVVWFGIEFLPKVLLAGILVYFIVFFSTFSGIRGVDRDYINMARLLGASRSQVILTIILPAAWQEISLGLRLAVPQALFGAIVGEFIVSSKGLGYLVLFNTSQLNTAGVYSAVILLTVLAVLLTGLVELLSSRSRLRKKVQR